MSMIERLRERWARFIRNLQWLGPDIANAWKCPHCDWLNRDQDEICLLCIGRKGGNRP